jgi:Leucine rich repeat N-terminal domain
MLLLVLLVGAVRAAATAQQRSALLSFCGTTNVEDVLERWCEPGSDVCTWEGVTCAGAAGVVGLSLRNSLLTGAWPGGFDSQMHGLREIDVVGVGISGTIGTSLFLNSNATLASFSLANTDALGADLAGVMLMRVPLPALHDFLVSVTATSGAISAPGSLFDAPALTTFRVEHSLVSGSFNSSAFAAIVATIQTFSVRGNAIMGAVDGFLCSASNTRHVDFSRNRITSFDPCIKIAAGFRLSTCNLERNALCGQPVNLSPCVYDTVANAALDVCGVCDGVGESCLDCSDVVNGTAVRDVCGVCGGTGSTCADCAGVPAGTSRYDACDVCNGASACADCAGVPNGSSTYDICDVCNGGNVVCVDCRGNLFGTARYDACDVCGGTNTTCTDCRGVSAGTSRYDACDVCDGDNACADCAGQVGGTAVYDACGVCGGDGAGCGVSDLLDDISDARDNAASRTAIVVSAILVALLALVCVAGFVAQNASRKRK